MWGRQSYRWNKWDFEANGKEGVAVDWPIRYKDMEPWYSYVEKFAGIAGNKDGLRSTICFLARSISPRFVSFSARPITMTLRQRELSVISSTCRQTWGLPFMN